MNATPETTRALYAVHCIRPGNWAFRSPLGISDGFLSEADATRIAAAQERQDREEALTGTGPIAAVLRSAFA
jgi:hypothetical protein